MNSLVKVVSSAADNLKRLTVKFFANGPVDIRESVQAAPFGIDSNPIKDMVAIQAETPERGKNYVIGYLNKNVLSEPGETRLFSVNDSGELQAWLWLKKDGTIEVLGSDDNLVRYKELEKGFNELRSDFNKLVTSFNSHVHATAATGPPVPPTPIPNSIPALASSASINGAKFDEVKTK